jgi:nucleotide-binding universal stress UspA family protein
LCDIRVVQQRDPRTRDEATRTIVVGADGSDGSNAAIRWCAAEASAHPARVVAVHAVPPVVYMVPPTLTTPTSVADPAELHQHLQSALEAWCAPLRDAQIVYETRVVDGGAAQVLVEVADEQEAALVVVGRRGHGGFAELVLGSVPHRLAHHARTPLVIVPG